MPGSVHTVLEKPRPLIPRSGLFQERILQCFVGTDFDVMQVALQREAQRHPYAAWQQEEWNLVAVTAGGSGSVC